eukprot:scaffold8451_cov30-Tisochrysis_lutea.AAC.4
MTRDCSKRKRALEAQREIGDETAPIDGGESQPDGGPSRAKECGARRAGLGCCDECPARERRHGMRVIDSGRRTPKGSWSWSPAKGRA